MSREMPDWQIRAVIIFVSIAILFLGVVIYVASDPHDIFTDEGSWYNNRAWKRDDNASHGGRSIDGQRSHHIPLDEGCGQVWIRGLDDTPTPSCVPLPVPEDTEPDTNTQSDNR